MAQLLDGIWVVSAQDLISEYECQHKGECVTFVGCGSRENPTQRQGMQGADQVQAQPPQVSGVGGAVTVFGPSGPDRTVWRFRGSGRIRRGSSPLPTRHRRRVYGATC